ncbi:MAG: GNAT family protein [Hyphomicrobium sp.]
MAFLRSPLPEDYLGPIAGPRLTLRPPAINDYARWAELRSLSRAHLAPWEPAWARDELTRSAYRRRLRAYGHDARDDLGYSFFLINTEDNALMGGLTFSNIRRGAAQTASLGYWTGAPYARRGHMQEAVSMVIPFAFRALRLHRLEAASMTDNIASQRVLEKSGFVKEGLARRYLKINGAWEDHLIYAMTEEDAAAKGLLRGNFQ